MADTATANYAFIKVEIGGSPSTWGNKLNNNFDSIDAQIKARADAIALRAPIDSPTFTGIPSAPTAAPKTNNTQLATTEYADRAAKSYRIVGELVDLPHSSIPTGWLECNGQAVSRVIYAELFAKIGTAYGAGDGATTFNVPDYQEVVSVARRISGAQTVYPWYGINTSVINSRADTSGVKALLQANLPAVQIPLTINPAGSHSHTLPWLLFGNVDGGGGPFSVLSGSTATSVAPDHVHTGVTHTLGNGTPFSLFQPSAVIVRVIYTGVIP